MTTDNSNIIMEEEEQFIFIVRHGDRWDYSHPEWLDMAKRRYDPPLSQLGHQQAREAGIFIDRFLAEKGVPPENITWLSSPFLRCLQTSDDAINAFTQLDTQTIQINPEYSVFEMDGHNGKLHADLPPVEERTLYFPRVNAKHESLFTPTLPEGRMELITRCEKAMKVFNQRYQYSPLSAFIIVTHAAGCVALAKAGANKTLADISAASPCSLYLLRRSQQTDEWTIDPHDAPEALNGFVGHLSSVGSTTRPWNHFGDKKVNLGYTGPPNSPYAPKKNNEL